MQFFKAILVPHAPYVRWALWAHSLDEIIAMGEQDNPLIIPDELRPEYLFDGMVCPMKIVDGELVDLNSGEVDAFEAIYEQRQAVGENSLLIKDINRGTFNYAGKTYPLHDAARARYMAIGLDTPHTNSNFMTTSGEVVTIAAADVPAFMSQFYKGVQLITNVVPTSEE